MRRAAYRYWNGAEWTANTRGPAPTGGAARSGRPVPASASRSSAEPVGIDPVAVDPVAVEPVAIDPVAIEPVAVETERGRRARVSLLAAVLLAAAAFVGGLALGRMVLADDGVTSSTSSSSLRPLSTTIADASSPTTGTPVGSAEIERLGTALAEAERQRDEAASALATSQADLAAAGAGLENREAHVGALRSWFTAEVLDRAQAAFDREVDRACRAADEPTLDNTTHTRNMEPAGTHVDLVAAAVACRSGG